MNSRRDTLTYEPVILKFGTSGRRGLVADLSQLEVYLNLRAEFDFLLELSAAEGGVQPGSAVYIAYDLRQSSTAFVPQYRGRGELAQTAIEAVEDAGLRPVLLGALPTPALTAYALWQGSASIMLTGSHIPFDRNGYKLNTAAGELMKSHEPLIAKHTERRRAEFYNQPSADSLFDEEGMFRGGHRDLPPCDEAAAEAYKARLTRIFSDALDGMRLLFYQHSSVGRDLMPELLEGLGATVVRAGRSDVFVPIDTENLGSEQLELTQRLYEQATADGSHFDAVVSCDGDADRPLLLAIQDGALEFISGDLLGMLTAEYLEPDAVVVPISCNPAIDESPLRAVLRPKTKIGSPFVIAAMQDAIAEGAKRVCGWEANGGFLLGTDFVIDGKTLLALPTRDAALPIVASLLLAKRKKISLHDTVSRLPKRFGATALLREFPRDKGLALVAALSPDKETSAAQKLEELRGTFAPALLAEVRSVDYTDGVRMYGNDGEVLHLRPSGNADEFRVYAVAASRERAQEIASVAENFLAGHRV
jgi:phosphomannomutase